MDTVRVSSLAGSPDVPMTGLFEALHLTVLQRDWLSSNHIVFADPGGDTAAVVDTGYSSHATHTVALLKMQLGHSRLTRILNTHLHSDHCGGNQALQAHWPGVQTWVPEAAFPKAKVWDEEKLTYRLTGQTCDPFTVDHALQDGQVIELGGRPWRVHAVSGHDPDAVVLFEPEHRVLISGDALWRNKVAVLFPELDGEAGFAPALATLDLIEGLNPSAVIPGHGEPFKEVADALAISRRRLRKLQSEPELHVRHALRVLMVFHLMEYRSRPVQALCDWMARSPMAQRPAIAHLMRLEPSALAQVTLQSLLDDGVVQSQNGIVSLV